MKINNYKNQSIITNPKKFENKYQDLPKTPIELLKVVQSLVIHGDQGKLYGISFNKQQSDEELLRTIPQMLKRIFEINSNPLTIPRNPKQRLVGMCRDYSLLLVSLLRYRGFEARMRAGFANYFESELTYEDHWLVEYYDTLKKRWIRIDAQIDDIQKNYFQINFDTHDVGKTDGFLTGSEAWIRCQQGHAHPDDFGYNKNWKGWHSVKGNLLHDFNNMIGLELLPWDLWTELSSKKYNQLTRAEKNLLDEMAEILSSGNIKIEDLNLLIEKLPEDYLKSIFSQLKILGISEIKELGNPLELEKKFKFTKSINKSIKNSLCHNKSSIYLKGGRQNNLKDVEVTIPKNQITVITGVSGSGKSSLAFDTIYEEGKRRYFENLSNGAKLSEQLQKPEFDLLQGLTPTIAIEQKKGSQNPRSTVGTLTSIWDYLRMLFVSIGKSYCPYCKIPLEKKNNTKNYCPHCQTIFSKINTSTFNANSHTGACHDCNGLGFTYQVNPQLIVKDPTISILDGATYYFGKLRGKKPNGNWMVGELYAIAKDKNIDLDIPWNELPRDFIDAILYGTDDKIYEFSFESKGRESKIRRPASGAINHIQRLFRESSSENNTLHQYMNKIPCNTCGGELLCIEARFTTIKGYRFPELTKMTIEQLWNWLCELPNQLQKNKLSLVNDILTELKIRVSYLLKVGLSYISTDRTAPTLSGGELQRVRLSSQLGSELVGLTYILDEPSIGLHPRDHNLIIKMIEELRDKGNTVIVVEHDKDTILSADYIIDVGPSAGTKGGFIIAEGTTQEIIKNPNSITGKYLSTYNKTGSQNKTIPSKWLSLKGCHANNLKNIDVEIPLNCMCSITGVSGSGKSSLVFHSLLPALEEKLKQKSIPDKNYTEFTGFDAIDDFILMDQTPIGKSSRSTPATYINIFDEIRSLFAETPQAKQKLLDESYFSFNSKKGQCPNCQGLGKTKIILQYMADQWVTCSECQGKRYQKEILSIQYKGKTIADILDMEVAEAKTFFSDCSDIYRKLSLLDEVGLGYLKLGQNTLGLSGGESQRIKLAKELGTKTKKRMLYILDEPTTGLHFKDIENLLITFRKLVNEQHSLLIIEHNTEVIRASDWIIDIGPDSGINGGEIVASGTPDEIKINPNSITGHFI
ncbi:TPA: excinuclease ABC subunit UvrA [Clostridioides difficile]|nr:excinuclease ABC subunit UvrA [Clostridioides difficile]HBH1326690.1 excinuclease ABC subunit UvrA [Clostridioides difficile]